MVTWCALLRIHESSFMQYRTVVKVEVYIHYSIHQALRSSAGVELVYFSPNEKKIR